MEGQVKNKFYKRWWFWVLAVVVFFIIIGSSGSSSPTKVGDVGDTNSPKQIVFKVGDQIQSDDMLLTVTNVTKNWKSSNQFDKPSNPDDVYVVVSVVIENKGSEDLDLSGLWDFKLEDANGVQKGQSIGGIGIKKLPTGSLSPNGKTSGDVLFEADKNALTTLKLRYKPLFSFADEIVIELQ